MGKRRRADWQKDSGATEENPLSDAGFSQRIPGGGNYHWSFVVRSGASDNQLIGSSEAHFVHFPLSGSEHQQKVKITRVGHLRFMDKLMNRSGNLQKETVHPSLEKSELSGYGNIVFLSGNFGDLDVCKVSRVTAVADKSEMQRVVNGYRLEVVHLPFDTSDSIQTEADEQAEQLLTPLLDSAITAQRAVGRAMEEMTTQLQSLREWAATLNSESTTSKRGGTS